MFINQLQIEGNPWIDTLGLYASNLTEEMVLAAHRITFDFTTFLTVVAALLLVVLVSIIFPSLYLMKFSLKKILSSGKIG